VPLDLHEQLGSKDVRTKEASHGKYKHAKTFCINIDNNHRAQYNTWSRIRAPLLPKAVSKRGAGRLTALRTRYYGNWKHHMEFKDFSLIEKSFIPLVLLI
jgi:hypothetical protein